MRRTLFTCSLFLLGNVACFNISFSAQAQSSNTCTGKGPEGSQAIPVTPKIQGDFPSPLYVGKTGDKGNGMNQFGKPIDTFTRCIFFKDASANPQPSSKPGKTWVVIHGLDNDSNYGMKTVAEAIAAQNKEDRVLLLDWSEASRNAGGPGAIGEKISRGSYYAASWIAPITEVVVGELKSKYGISGSDAQENLNLVGHSLGSLMSAQIGKEFQKQGDGNNAGVSTIIALEPPSQINSTGLIANLTIGDLGGYDVDGRTPSYIPPDGEWNGRYITRFIGITPTQSFIPNNGEPERLPRGLQTCSNNRLLCNVDKPATFQSAAKFSRAFIGKHSFAGDPERAKTANESFEMDFGLRSDQLFNLEQGKSTFGDEHGFVVDTYANMVKENSFGEFGIFTSQQTTGIVHSERFEGTIRVSEKNKAEYLTAQSTDGLINFTLFPDGSYTADYIETTDTKVRVLTRKTEPSGKITTLKIVEKQFENSDSTYPNKVIEINPTTGSQLVIYNANKQIITKDPRTGNESMSNSGATSIPSLGSSEADKARPIASRITSSASSSSASSRSSTLAKEMLVHNSCIAQVSASHVGSASCSFKAANQPIQSENQAQNFALRGTGESIQQANQYTNGQIVSVPLDIGLTWNPDTKLDLDSHLATPNGEHVYFVDRGKLNEAPNAFLYRDSIPNGGLKGAEQTRITQFQNGEYRFYVYNFSEGGSQGYTSNSLSDSNAIVKLYEGGDPLTNVPNDPAVFDLNNPEVQKVGAPYPGDSTFKVPVNQTGNTWYVFKLNTRTGILYRVDHFGNSPDSSSVPNVR